SSPWALSVQVNQTQPLLSRTARKFVGRSNWALADVAQQRLRRSRSFAASCGSDNEIFITHVLSRSSCEVTRKCAFYRNRGLHAGNGKDAGGAAGKLRAGWLNGWAAAATAPPRISCRRLWEPRKLSGRHRAEKPLPQYRFISMQRLVVIPSAV